nr:MAG TPA: hypothetical protein [Caudoviricetes sp.]
MGTPQGTVYHRDDQNLWRGRDGDLFARRGPGSLRKGAEDMAETLVNFVILLVVVGFAAYEASSGNIAMTVYACTLLVLFSLLWKMESIERRLKRLCELLEGEGDDGED